MTHDERFERAWNAGEVLTKKGAKEAFLKEFSELQAENDQRLDSEQRSAAALQAEVQEWVRLGAEQGVVIAALDEKLKGALLQNGVMRKALEDIAKREGAGLDGSTENATGRKARLALEGKYETPCPTCGYSYWMGSCCTHCGFVENRDGERRLLVDHIGGEGYAGVPVLPGIVHDKHCCASRGCHQVCSHLCGTELEAKCCKPVAENRSCAKCGKTTETRRQDTSLEVLECCAECGTERATLKRDESFAVGETRSCVCNCHKYLSADGKTIVCSCCPKPKR